MIELIMHMNSNITEVMEWKCCNVSGLNLELIFHNPGKKAVTAPNSFMLENDTGQIKIDTIYPPWPQQIFPNDYASIYCAMDDSIWQKYHTLSIKLANGREYRFPIDHASD